MADTIYKDLRKKLDLTREQVCDEATKRNQVLTYERLERIENGKFNIHPEEVILLSELYKEPALCNHYCSKMCEIGQKYVPEIKTKDLAQIVLEMLASLNSLDKQKARLVEITVDGIISEDEMEDFKKIQEQLEYISMAIDSLQLWVQKAIMDGKIAEED